MLNRKDWARYLAVALLGVVVVGVERFIPSPELLPGFLLHLLVVMGIVVMIVVIFRFVPGTPAPRVTRKRLTLILAAMPVVGLVLWFLAFTVLGKLNVRWDIAVWVVLGALWLAMILKRVLAKHGHRER